jgi:hypothetical protein
VQGDVEVKCSVISTHRFRIPRCRCLQGAAVSDRRLPKSTAWKPPLLESRDPIKRAAENRRRAGSSISKWRSLHMTKETQKALAIIITSLGVLVALLIWANHLRPHP